MSFSAMIHGGLIAQLIEKGNLMARAKKQAKEKELTLEDALLACRNALRGVGSLEKNRDAVISLVFLRFAGDKFEKRRAELMEEYGDIPSFLEKPSFYNAANVFYLEEEKEHTYAVRITKSNELTTKEIKVVRCKLAFIKN